MATITVSEQDVISADAYLSAYLKEKVPDADFSAGSVVRDFVVKAIAHIFAYFRAEIQKTRDHQSLLALQALPPSAEVDEAVDALLSNIFMGRRGGSYARVVATLHLSSSVDVVIPTGTRFFRSGLTFVVDATENLYIPASALRQVLLNSSSASEFVTTVALICTTTGETGNVTPGRFSGTDRFSPFVAYAENLDYGVGGKGAETTAEIIARTPTALSVRNLVNVRSVKAVLLERFPSLTGVLTTGFGEPEMTRDRVSEGVTGIDMHVGGHMDVYVKLPPVAVSEQDLAVGGNFERADGVVNVFVDTAAYSFTSAGVLPGHVLKVHAGITGAPREFIIKGVDGATLTFADRASFPAAVSSGLRYSVGALSPLYDDIIPLRETGSTVNRIQAANAVFLAGRPKGKIRKLEIQSYSGSSWSSWSSLSRVNALTPSAGEFSVETLNPALFQSSQAVEKLVVPTDALTRRVRVTYDTLAGFDTVSAAVTNAFERNVCANSLVRGFIPVYVSVLGTYALSPGAVPPADAVIKQAVGTFLAAWDNTAPLDVSAVTAFLRKTFPAINRFYDPVTIYFTVYTPDGQMYEFQTTDVVRVFPDGRARVSLRGVGALPLRDEVRLSGLRLPDSGSEFAVATLTLRGIFSEFGISERNIRFFPDPDSVSITPYID